ncbi:MAG: efflux RND transporter periplasmic adaptor subunit, partial [Chloroflexota bacterium]
GSSRSNRQAPESTQVGLEKTFAAPSPDTASPGGATVAHNSTACGAAKASADAAIVAANAAQEAAQGQLDLLKRGGGPSQQAQIQGAVDQAQAQLKSAQAKLEALTTGGIASQRAQLLATKQQAQGTLVQAQGNLFVAQANLGAAQNGTLDAQVKSAASAVTAARERFKSDQAKLDVASQGPTDEHLQQAQSAVDQAAQALALAQQPNTVQDIRSQRASVEQTRQQLLKAQQPNTATDLEQQEQAVAQAAAQLHKVQTPYTDTDLANARAAVAQAAGQLSSTQLGLADTRLLAPTDGIIADVQVAPGALVGTTTTLMTLVPPGLEVVVNAEESALGQLAEGQTVQLNVTAFPSQPFDGTIKAINPTLDTKSRTASVHVVPNNPYGKLRAGMSTDVVVQTARVDDAIIVPPTAVQQRSGQQFVFTDVDGRARMQLVKIGLANASAVQITSGVQVGDTVVLPGSITLSDGESIVAAGPPTTATLPAVTGNG